MFVFALLPFTLNGPAFFSLIGHLQVRRNCCCASCLVVAVEAEVKFRPTASPPLCLVVGLHCFLSDNCGFLWCGAPSLTKGWVSNLLVQLLLDLARAVSLGSKSLRTHEHILMSHWRPPLTWRTISPYLYPQKQGGPVIPPDTGSPFRRLLHLAGLWWRRSNPPPLGHLFCNYSGFPFLLLTQLLGSRFCCVVDFPLVQCVVS
jgi:hypothetical protein